MMTGRRETMISKVEFTSWQCSCGQANVVGSRQCARCGCDRILQHAGMCDHERGGDPRGERVQVPERSRN